MTTAATIISDALKELGVLAEGETMSGEQQSDGLRVVNRVLERWSNQRLMAMYEAQLSYTLTGAQSFTVGPSGADLTAARPIAVLSAYSELASISYPMRVMTATQWDSIGYKPVSGGAPAALYYQAAPTTGTVYVFQPTSGYVLKMRVLTVLQAFTSATDSVTLAPGYEEALVLSTAIRLAPQYGAQIRPDTLQAERSAIRSIKRINVQVPMLSSVPGTMGDRAYFESGGQ